MSNPRSLTRALLTLVVLATSLFGQTAYYHDRALGVNPFTPGAGAIPSPIFLPHGQARVCGPLPASGSPCTPVATIFDANTGQPLTVGAGQFGQVTTDTTGQFGFACVSGNYEIQIAPVSSNTPQLQYNMTCPIPSNVTLPVTSTIEACLSLLPITGGTCQVPPNFAETPTGNITISTPNSTIQCLGPMVLNMGANQIIVPTGTSGVTISCPTFQGGASVATAAAIVHYTGNSAAILVGSESLTLTINFQMNGIAVDLTGAGSSAIGVDLASTAAYQLVGNTVFTSSSGTNQIALLLDANVGFTGDGKVDGWRSNVSPGVGIGIKFLGSANYNTVTNCVIPGVASTALLFTFSADGNIVNCDIEAATIAVAMTGSNYQNHVTIYGGANGTDFSLGASTSSNTLELAGGVPCPAPSAALGVNVSDAGTNNKIIYRCAVNFSRLPSWSNGNNLYCADCNATCAAGASTGQECWRVNGGWLH